MKQPGMRINSKCKVCKISKVHMDIFNDIHVLRFKQNLTLEDVTKELSSKLTDRGYDSILIPNLQNLSGHFRNHIPVDLIAQYKMQNRKRIPRKVKEEKRVSEETKSQINELVNDKVGLYDRLEGLYDILNKRFNDFDTAMNNTMTLNNYDGYSNITKELRSMVIELNKMKQSEQLLKTVIDVAFNTYTTRVFQEILKEVEKIKTVLKVYVRDKNTVDNLIEDIESKIASYFVEASKESLNIVKAQFKL